MEPKLIILGPRVGRNGLGGTVAVRLNIHFLPLSLAPHSLSGVEQSVTSSSTLTRPRSTLVR